MRKNLILAIVFLMSLSTAGLSMAEDQSPPQTSPEKAGTSSIQQIKDALGLSIYLQAGYTFNFDNPGSGENGLRIFDHKSNSFTLDLAQLVFSKAPEQGLGYKVKLSAGEAAKFIHSLGLGISAGENPDESEAFDLTEAYLTYTTRIGRGLKFQFGKFVTMHGAEVIEAIDDMNYSRSFLFNFAIPFTHTGFAVFYPASGKLTLSGYLVNGWDNTDDNNTAKTFGASASLTPVKPLSLTLNLMYGPEKDNNNHDNRFLFDWVGTLKATDKLTFTVNTDYGTEEHSSPSGGTAEWYGAAGYAKYDLDKTISLAARGEYFKDRDGIRTGIPQSLKEITLTPEIKLPEGVLLRPEYRHDWSDEASFNNKKQQDTIGLGVMYRW